MHHPSQWGQKPLLQKVVERWIEEESSICFAGTIQQQNNFTCISKYKTEVTSVLFSCTQCVKCSHQTPCSRENQQTLPVDPLPKKPCTSTSTNNQTELVINLTCSAFTTFSETLCLKNHSCPTNWHPQKKQHFSFLILNDLIPKGSWRLVTGLSFPVSDCFFPLSICHLATSIFLSQHLFIQWSISVSHSHWFLSYHLWLTLSIGSTNV